MDVLNIQQGEEDSWLILDKLGIEGLSTSGPPCSPKMLSPTLFHHYSFSSPTFSCALIYNITSINARLETSQTTSRDTLFLLLSRGLSPSISFFLLCRFSHLPRISSKYLPYNPDPFLRSNSAAK